MAEDFYQDDYYGGGYYDGGEISPDYAPGFELLPQQEPTYFPLESSDSFWSGQIGTGEQIGTPDTTSLWQESYLDWLATGLNPESAAYFADLDLEAAVARPGVITIAQSATELNAPTLPEIPAPADTYFPYYPYNYWETPPYIPPFDIEPPPSPPGPQLPPYCPVGTYHPYPIGHPQQDVCAPFPPATTQQQQQPKPPARQPAPAPSAPKPRTPQQQQQPCPTGYCKHPTTGQCVLIPQGYYRHPQTQICTATTAQVSPLLPIPTEATDMFADLKKLPWWVWVAGAGLLLLSMGGEERKSVTIRHRRAD